MAISDLLTKLIELKNQLVSNLNIMGVAADQSEKLNTLVPKVLECETEQNVEWVDSPSGSIKGVLSGSDYCINIQTYIKKINIPKGITSLSGYVFTMCTNLESITIPNSVTSIGDSVFQHCSNLPSITIPDSVTSIGSTAFAYCSNLSDIYYTGTEAKWNAITKGTLWDYNMSSNVSGGTTIHYNYAQE